MTWARRTVLHVSCATLWPTFGQRPAPLLWPPLPEPVFVQPIRITFRGPTTGRIERTQVIPAMDQSASYAL